MLITHLGHACVLVEARGARVLIDPGDLSAHWRCLTGLDAVLATHRHPDHLDPGRIGRLLAANPGAALLGEAAALEAAGAPGRPVAPGDRFDVGPLRVWAVGGWHATIHSDIPRVGNVGYVVEAEGEPSFLHPGDQLDAEVGRVDVVAIPAHGPWAATREVVDFVRRIGAPRGFLIHQGLLNERGEALVRAHLANLSGAEVVGLSVGDPWDASAGWAARRSGGGPDGPV